MIEIKNLNSSINEEKIIKDLSIKFEKGKVYAIMGQNGSGKSTFANSIFNHPKYNLSGEILFNNKNLLELKTEDISKEGVFLSFQHPEAIEGLKISSYLRSIMNSRRENPIKINEFSEKLNEALEKLKLPKEFADRELNVGLSGGEKKKCEMLQMLLTNPNVLILDETDSGLDIDAIKIVGDAVNSIKNEEKTILLITHYKKMLDLIQPDEVIVLKEGQIAQKGGKEIIDKLEEEGYSWLE